MYVMNTILYGIQAVINSILLRYDFKYSESFFIKCLHWILYDCTKFTRMIDFGECGFSAKDGETFCIS